MNYTEDQLNELDQQYRIMRQESEQPFDYIVSDLIIKLIEDLNTERKLKEDQIDNAYYAGIGIDVE